MQCWMCWDLLLGHLPLLASFELPISRLNSQSRAHVVTDLLTKRIAAASITCESRGVNCGPASLVCIPCCRSFVELHSISLFGVGVGRRYGVVVGHPAVGDSAEECEDKNEGCIADPSGGAFAGG